ncbi:MAG: DUF4198 domain-containing protein [Gemmataceae bacterium]|nr:DUF4198 domain-containing protein [Gemmataceae bacterium]
MPPNPRRALGALGLLVVCLAALGCGDNGRLPTRPVSGKVTLDGQPLAGAEVWLVPTDANTAVKTAKITVRPYAKTKADGTFALTSYLPDDGAPDGPYAVMVVLEGAAANTEEERANDTPADPKAARKARRPFFPRKYTDPTTSGLSFAVGDGPNQLDLDLKSK